MAPTVSESKGLISVWLSKELSNGRAGFKMWKHTGLLLWWQNVAQLLKFEINVFNERLCSNARKKELYLEMSSND